MPDFILPSGSQAINAGLDLSKSFTINGVTYNALPGMTSGYYRGVAPDIGAFEIGASGVIFGDVSGDGSVTTYDAALCSQYSVGLATLTSAQVQRADVTGDGAVSSYDAALIAQYAVGLITKFPVGG